MAVMTKRFKAAEALVDRSKSYSIEEAMDIDSLEKLLTAIERNEKNLFARDVIDPLPLDLRDEHAAVRETAGRIRRGTDGAAPGRAGRPARREPFQGVRAGVCGDRVRGVRAAVERGPVVPRLADLLRPRHLAGAAA